MCGRKRGDRSDRHSMPRDGTGPLTGRKSERGLLTDSVSDVFYAEQIDDRDGPPWQGKQGAASGQIVQSVIAIFILRARRPGPHPGYISM